MLVKINNPRTSVTYCAVSIRVSLPCSTRSLSPQLPWSLEDICDITTRRQLYILIWWSGTAIQISWRKDFGHMFIQPFDLVANSKAKLLGLLSDKLASLSSLCDYPWRGAHRHFWSQGGHVFGDKQTRVSSFAALARELRRSRLLRVSMIRHKH